MSDEASGVPPLLAFLAEGFSVPFLGLFALVGIVWGVVTHNMEATSPTPKEVVETPETPGTEPTRELDPTPDPTPDPTGTPVPSGPATASAAEAAIDAGEFERALAIAKRAQAVNMAERARLFIALTRTIKPGALARATLTRVLTSDRTVIGIVNDPKADPLVVEQVDGKEVRLEAASVKSKEPLSGEVRAAALRSELQKARTQLGTTAGGLTLHRLCYLAYSTGLRDLGTTFLKEALIGKEGSILVDMFGGSDFDRLHRARREMAGEPVEDEPVPIAQVPDDPEPEPTARPDPVEPIEPKKDPAGWRVKRTPGTKGPKQADPLLSESQWTEADEAYRSGLRLYRGTFGRSNRAATKTMKGAMKEFRRAQQLLTRLANRYPDNYTLERREQEVGKLILDCMKRSGLR